MVTLTDPALIVAAEVLDDLEASRIANENRLRTLTTPAPDGFGLSAEHEDVARLAGIVAGLAALEKDAGKTLDRHMKRHPLGEWVTSRSGVGLRQAARLLAAVGDPYLHPHEDRPRKVGEFLSYCGYREKDGVAVKRRSGVSVNWNATAKTRAWLIAQSCVKVASSPYRQTYDDARKRYGDAVHASPCARCGPAGSPAQAGSALNPGHQHARALRFVSKEILADLWRESRRLHEAATDTSQSHCE
jgi:hypothetical protein